MQTSGTLVVKVQGKWRSNFNIFWWFYSLRPPPLFLYKGKNWSVSVEKGCFQDVKLCSSTWRAPADCRARLHGDGRERWRDSEPELQRQRFPRPQHCLDHLRWTGTASPINPPVSTCWGSADPSLRFYLTSRCWMRPLTGRSMAVSTAPSKLPSILISQLFAMFPTCTAKTRRPSTLKPVSFLSVSRPEHPPNKLFLCNWSCSLSIYGLLLLGLGASSSASCCRVWPLPLDWF